MIQCQLEFGPAGNGMCRCGGGVTLTVDVDVSRIETWLALAEPVYLCRQNGERITIPLSMSKRLWTLALGRISEAANGLSDAAGVWVSASEQSAQPGGCGITLTRSGIAVCPCSGGLTVSLDVEMSGTEDWVAEMDELYSCRKSPHREAVPIDMWDALYAAAVNTATLESPDREGPWLVDMRSW